MAHQTNGGGFGTAKVTRFSTQLHHDKPEEHEEKEDKFDEDIDLETALTSL